MLFQAAAMFLVAVSARNCARFAVGSNRGGATYRNEGSDVDGTADPATASIRLPFEMRLLLYGMLNSVSAGVDGRRLR
jgi:hypothetical protein